MLGRNGCLAAFHAAVAASDADIAIVEGCMGLHDGREGATDDGSTAQVAKWLRAPVLLVVDAWNLARSAAAMVHGYQSFDPEVMLAATVFNRVAGAAHGTWIAQAMGSHPGTAAVRVLGCLPPDKRIELPERLLGLLPPAAAVAAAAAASATGNSATGKAAGDGAAGDGDGAAGDGDGAADAAGATGGARLAALLRLFSEHVDLEQLRWVAATAEPPPTPPPAAMPLPAAPASAPLPPVRVAVARDAAFCFYYHESLRLLERAGATLQW